MLVQVVEKATGRKMKDICENSLTGGPWEAIATDYNKCASEAGGSRRTRLQCMHHCLRTQVSRYKKISTSKGLDVST